MASTSKGAAQAAGEMEEFGRISGLAIRRFAGFTLATGIIFGLIRAIVGATQAAISFERQLIKVSQVTGTSIRGLRGLSDEITFLATNLGVSSAELVEVSRTLSQAGFTATETKRALAAIAKTDLAPTFDNIRQTTEGSIAALRQFNLEVTDLESVLGSINAVASKFAVESGDIIGAIRRTGGVFAAASGTDSEDATKSLREFIALFTSVRATTRESSESIATGLRTIFTRIQRRSTVDALDKIGVKLLDLEGKFVGPFEAFKRLNKELKDLEGRDPRFAKLVQEIGGFRQIGKVIPAIQKNAVAQEAFKVATEGQNSLTKDAEIAQKSLAVQINKTREEFIALIRDITQGDTFGFLAKGVLTLSKGLIGLASSLGPIIPLLAGLAIFKLGQSVIQFSRGFRRGIGQGGASELGERVGGIGSGSEKNTVVTSANTAAIAQNTVVQQSKTGILKASTGAQRGIQTALTANTTALGINTAVLKGIATAFSAGGRGIITGGRRQRKLSAGGRVSSPTRRFQKGGRTSIQKGRNIRRSSGGAIDDFVPALIEPQELVFSPAAVRQAGPEALARFNETGDPSGLGRFDSRGVSVVPGISRGDSFRTDLPSGSFVVRRSSAKGLAGNFNNAKRTKFNAGGSVGRFAKGGSPENRVAISQFSKDIISVGGTAKELKIGVDAIAKALNRGASEIDARAGAIKAVGQEVRKATAAGDRGISLRDKQNGPVNPLALQRRDRIGPGDPRASIDFERDAASRRNTERVLGGRPSIAGAPPVDIGSTNAQLKRIGVEASLKKFNLDTKRTAVAMRSYDKALRSGKSSQDALNIAQKRASVSQQRRTKLRRAGGGAIGRFGTRANAVVGGAGFGIAAFAGGPAIQKAFGDDTPGAAARGAGVSGGLIGGFIGAQIGSAFGPIGTAIGAIGGALIGSVSAAIDAWREVADKIARTNVEDELKNFTEALRKFSSGDITEGESNAAADRLTDVAIGNIEFQAGGKADSGFINSLLRFGSNIFDKIAGSSDEEIKRREVIFTNKGVFGGISALFSDSNATNREIEVTRGKDIRERGKATAETFEKIIAKRIAAGVEGEAIFASLGIDKADFLAILGSQDVEASELIAFNALSSPEKLAERKKKKEAPRVRSKEEIARLKILEAAGKKRRAQIKKDAAEQTAFAAKVALASQEIRLLGLRFRGLADGAKIAARASQGLQSQFDTISAGFTGTNQINLPDLGQNIDLITKEAIGDRFNIIRGFTGGDTEAIGDIEKVLAGVKFLRTEGIQILGNAASKGNISGESAEELSKNLFALIPEFQDLNPILKAQFEIGIKRLFGKREGGLVDLSKIIENDPRKLVDIATGNIGKEAQQALDALGKSIAKTVNDFKKNSSIYAKSQLEAAAIQDRINSLTLERENKRRELSGQQVSIENVRNVRNKRVEALARAGGLGPTTNPTEIAADILRLREKRQLLQTKQSRLKGGSIEFITIENALTKNTVQGVQLESALKILATDVTLLSAIEKKIAKIQERRGAGDSLLEKLFIAQNDPKAALDLTKQFAAALAILEGRPTAPGDTAAGLSILREIQSAGPKTGKQNQDLLRQLFKQGSGLNAQPRGGVLQKFFDDAQGVDTQNKAIANFKTASDNQIKAINEQKALQDANSKSLQTKLDVIFQQQTAALIALPGKIAEVFANVNPIAIDNKKVTPVAIDKKVTGGIIPGAFQGSKKDSKLINAQPGEFIVRRTATRDNLELLERINAGGFVNGGLVSDKVKRAIEKQRKNKREFRDDQSAGKARRLNEVQDRLTKSGSRRPKLDRELFPPGFEPFDPSVLSMSGRQFKANEKAEFEAQQLETRKAAADSRKRTIEGATSRFSISGANTSTGSRERFEAQRNPARNAFLQRKEARKRATLLGKKKRREAFLQGKTSRRQAFFNTGRGQKSLREIERREVRKAGRLGARLPGEVGDPGFEVGAEGAFTRPGNAARGRAGAGGSAAAATGVGIVNPAAIAAMTSLTTGLNNLAQFATSLNQTAEKLSGLDLKIQIESAPIQVNVVINGAEAFANMEPAIKTLVQDKIDRALMMAINPITGETAENFVGQSVGQIS